MNKLSTIRQCVHGFSIAELLIVIAVIGILASIALVLYPGYQQRTRDNERKSDIQQISAALSAYALQKNNFAETGSGCGLNGNGNGWLNAGPSDLGSYPKSIATCLQEAGVLAQGEFLDPTGCVWDSGGNCGSWNGAPAKAYMKATCQKGGSSITYVMAHLETQSRSDAVIDALCDAGTVNGFSTDGQKWGTHYGMNYYVSVR